MNAEGDFSVDFTLPARIDLVSILQRAVGRPVFGEIQTAAFRIEERLKQDPRGIGDPLYHLRAMKMTIMSVTEPPLYICYGVHDIDSVVVIRSVQLIR
jgi:hypothetical protein